jgi:hypothetical protein
VLSRQIAELGSDPSLRLRQRVRDGSGGCRRRSHVHGGAGSSPLRRARDRNARGPACGGANARACPLARGTSTRAAQSATRARPDRTSSRS